MNVDQVDSGKPSITPSVASHTWAVRRAEKADLQSLLALFLRSFESPLTVARWDWKYAHASCWGTVVERDGGLVGFFGGMPRQFTLHNKLVTGVQIGDCMVDPGQRGVLTRKGPMFLSAAAYFEQMADIHPGAEFAFGYPSVRAMGVGRRLGLYSNIDKISLMSWSALAPQRSVLTRTRRMNDWPEKRQQQAVTQLWNAMRASLPDVLLPVRDWGWFKHRYLDHPEYTYDLLIVSSRLTGQPKSLTVLRTHPDHLEFLDYLGSVNGVAGALAAARMQAANAGLPLLQGWFTQRLTQIFNIGEPVVQDAGIEVPTNIWGKAQVAGVLASPIWLMAGDSDFR